VHLEDRSLPRPAVIPRPGTADPRLVAQLRRGDAEAGRRFVREFYPAIYRYLLHLTGSRETAEDLTQQTFVRAWQSLGTLEDGGRLRPWLYRIAHREFLQAVRDLRPVASLAEVPEWCEPRAADETKAVELRAILAGLPIEEREMVVLHYLEGYSSEEIARSSTARVSSATRGSHAVGSASRETTGGAARMACRNSRRAMR
jgi:RNA polymerase sigma-70 factor (ECF subfamily)